MPPAMSSLGTVTPLHYGEVPSSGEDIFCNSFAVSFNSICFSFFVFNLHTHTITHQVNQTVFW